MKQTLLILLSIIYSCFVPYHSSALDKSCNLVEIYSERKILHSEFMAFGFEIVFLEEKKQKMNEDGRDTRAVDKEIELKYNEMDYKGSRISELLHEQTDRLTNLFKKRIEMQNLYNQSDDLNYRELLNIEIDKIDKRLNMLFHEIEKNKNV